VVNPSIMRILSLCTGGGGLDLGVELAVPDSRVVCGVEWDASACGYLAAAMQANCLAPFPVWSDIRTFDGRPWSGTVDCITAGYPCQPFSQTGRRQGADDPRHLWPHIARIIREVKSAIVFLENVSGHVSLGLREILAELHAMGYRIACGIFAASEVGAPHQRERVFVLADARSERSQRLREERPAAGATRRSGGTDIPLWPPGPCERERWAAILASRPDLAPAIESKLCRVANGLALHRDQRLRLLGNGVVPLQAAHAFCALAAELAQESAKETVGN